jgi:hypothetical protein
LIQWEGVAAAAREGILIQWEGVAAAAREGILIQWEGVAAAAREGILTQWEGVAAAAREGSHFLFSFYQLFGIAGLCVRTGEPINQSGTSAML